MNRLAWSDPALADLEMIGRYIRQFDPRAAERIVAAIDRATLRLVDFPLSGIRVPNRQARKLSVPRVRYLVFYVANESSVTILRIVHARRR